MRVLVTGGTGFLGQYVARALMLRGDQVSIMGRNFTGVKNLLDQGARPITVDLRDPAAVVRACAGMQAVCHCGALSAPWGKRSEFFATNVAGTQAILDGCRKYAVQRLVYISSPSVIFNGRDHSNLTEVAPYPTRFASVYSLTKKLGEDLLHAAPDIQSVILRPKAIFGPGDQSLLPRLIAAARKGRLPQIGSGRNLVDLTYVENAAQAAALALTAPAAVGKTYTITNGEHVLLWEVIRQVLSRLKIPSPRSVLPVGLAWSAALLMESAAALTGKEPLLTRYSVLILARQQTYDISAARNDLGYQPLFTLAEGIEKTLAA
jgi:2-alkyl-3-oxoalkanoate reductase